MDAERNHKLPLTPEAERAERIREILGRLIDLNDFIPVIVEGKNDASALRSLGLKGEIITLNRGRSLYEFCEDMAGRYPEVMLLTDWDPAGDALHTRLGEGLRGMWEAYEIIRAALRALTQKDIGAVEGIPALLRRLEDAPADPWR